MRHSTSNAILTKLFKWDYGNGDAPFSRQKIRKSFAFGALWRTYKVPCLYIRCVSTFSYWDKLKPFTALSMLICVAYVGKPISLSWHGSRQLHHNDRANNIAWICTYNNRFKHIPTLQGQEHSWLARVTCVITRVHHTKCMITHTHVGIYIYIHTHHAHCYHIG